jgi:hypothetical protein
MGWGGMPADRGGSGDRGEYFVLPGVYENSHRVREAWSIGFDDDPRFRDEDDDFDETAHEAARAEAEAAADRRADEKIREGKPIVATLLNPGWSLHPFRRSTFSIPRVPFFRDRDRMYDIHNDDRVVVNVEATAAWKAQRAAEDAHRITAAQAVWHRAAGAEAAGGPDGHRPCCPIPGLRITAGARKHVQAPRAQELRCGALELQIGSTLGRHEAALSLHDHRPGQNPRAVESRSMAGVPEISGSAEAAAVRVPERVIQAMIKSAGGAPALGLCGPWARRNSPTPQ